MKKEKRRHQYFDEICPEDKNSICLFNTNHKETDKKGKITKRQKKWNKQRKQYGFDERETWSLDFTTIAWLHSHLKMFLEIGGQVVDFTYYHFQIPVLKDNFEYSITNEGIFPQKPYLVQIEDHTQKECIELTIQYLEDALKYKDELEMTERVNQKARCAFRIFAEILPAMWW